MRCWLQTKSSRVRGRSRTALLSTVLHFGLKTAPRNEIAREHDASTGGEMSARTGLLMIMWTVAALLICTQSEAQTQVHRCVIEGRTVFQETPCSKPRPQDPVAAPANVRNRPDAEALRAEQARRRQELQKGFRDVREVPRPAPDSSRISVSPPPQSTSASMGFDDCIRLIQRTAGQLGVAPLNISETPDLRIVRFGTSDGSVLVTCSRPDRKMVTTVSRD